MNQASETRVKAASASLRRRQPGVRQSATASMGSTARASWGRQPMAAEALAPSARAAQRESPAAATAPAQSARAMNIRAGGSDMGSGPCTSITGESWKSSAPRIATCSPCAPPSIRRKAATSAAYPTRDERTARATRLVKGSWKTWLKTLPSPIRRG